MARQDASSLVSQVRVSGVPTVMIGGVKTVVGSRCKPFLLMPPNRWSPDRSAQKRGGICGFLSHLARVQRFYELQLTWSRTRKRS